MVESVVDRELHVRRFRTGRGPSRRRTRTMECTTDWRVDHDLDALGPHTEQVVCLDDLERLFIKVAEPTVMRGPMSQLG